MKLLVTGGAGFIGSALVRRALVEGLSVVTVDKLTYAGSRENLPDHAAHAFERVDVCDTAALEAVFTRHGPDAAMHLASESHVDRSIDDPAPFLRTNVLGTASVLEVCRRHGVMLHHVSTDEVFGQLGQTGRFSEGSPYAPRSPYAATKASADMLVRAWGATFGVPFVITSSSNTYGPRQHAEKLIPTVVLALREGRPIPLYGDGLNVRDWLHVDDHAQALLAVLRGGRRGETYCIGGGEERTNLALVQAICAIADRLRPEGAPHGRLIGFVADRPGHDRRYALDTAKIERELGWRPTTPLDEGLEATVRWYLR